MGLDRDQRQAEVADRVQEPVDGRLVGELAAQERRAVGLGGHREIGEHRRPRGSQLALHADAGPGSGLRDPSRTSVCSGATWPETYRPACGSTPGPHIHPRMESRVDSMLLAGRSGTVEDASNGTGARAARRHCTRPSLPRHFARPTTSTMAMPGRRRPTRDQDRRPGAGRSARRSGAAAGAARWRARGSAGARRGAGRLRQDARCWPTGSSEADVRSAWLVARPARRRRRPLHALPRRPPRSRGWSGRSDETRRARPVPAVRPELALAGVLDQVVDAAGGRAGQAGSCSCSTTTTSSASRPSIGSSAPSSSGCPPRARLAIATRSDPPLPLARLRARGELLEVRAADLRFTTSEAGELLRAAAVELDPAAMSPSSPSAPRAGRRRCAWPPSRSAADPTRPSSCGGSVPATASSSTTSSRRSSPDCRPETQDFLLRTSILDRLCGSLCDAVTGPVRTARRGSRSSSAPTCSSSRSTTSGAGTATTRCSRRSSARGCGCSTRASVPDLHARAAAWHEAQGDDDEAIAHALRSDDLERTPAASWRRPRCAASTPAS